VNTYNGLTIDLKSYTVTLRGQPVICTPKEIEILHISPPSRPGVYARAVAFPRLGL
jgi:DNA-binding response OmpR family regulator